MSEKTCKTDKIFNTKSIAEAGVLISLSVILQIIGSYSFAPISKFIFAEGWAPYLACIPLLVLMIRRGLILAVLGSIITEGINYLVANGNFLIAGSPIAFVIDYVVARVLSIFVGGMVAYLLRNQLKDKKITYITIILSVWLMIAFLGGFWSGVVFYAEYTQWSNAWVYSLVYNFSAYAVGFALTILTILLIKRGNAKMLEYQHGEDTY